MGNKTIFGQNNWLSSISNSINKFMPLKFTFFYQQKYFIGDRGCCIKNFTQYYLAPKLIGILGLKIFIGEKLPSFLNSVKEIKSSLHSWCAK